MTSRTDTNTEPLPSDSQPHPEQLRPQPPSSVQLRRPVTISGIGLNGREFSERAFTLDVAVNGGTIATFQALGPDGTIVVRSGRREITCHVLGQVGLIPDGHVYAFEFATSDPTFWGITFPAPERSLSPVELVCTECTALATLRLTRLEVDVFRVNRWISRTCPKCHRRTIFKAPSHVKDVASTKPKEKRKHLRVQMKHAKACILRHGMQDDVVEVINLSRKGVSFQSEKNYDVGMRVQVAVPYTVNGNNVFAAGRIIRVQRRARPEQRGEYALQMTSTNL